MNDGMEPRGLLITLTRPAIARLGVILLVVTPLGGPDPL
jgi:hypothetical protein